MSSVRLRLPATSANLGPGFDAVALALDLHLEVTAEPDAGFSIEAEGRNWEACSRLNNNLLIKTYQETLAGAGRPVVPLRLGMANGIPLGMGCGSSAAARLAGVALAVHFGELGWGPDRLVYEAARLEGHPDNVAACWYGGLTVAADAPERLAALTLSPPEGWRVCLVLPAVPLATARARAALPARYPRAEVVANLQSLALLVGAFACSRPEMLVLGTRDRLHQPYRAELCPLLPALLPMAGQGGVLSVTLSGAGPAALLLVAGGDGREAESGENRFAAIFADIKAEVEERTRKLGPLEILDLALDRQGTVIDFPAERGVEA